MYKKFTSYTTVRAIILNNKTENLTLFRDTMIIQHIKQFGQNVALKATGTYTNNCSSGKYVNEK